MSAYVSRYHRVRAYGMDSYGPALVLDRQRMELKPYLNEEWWRDPTSGLLLPVPSGGAVHGVQAPSFAFGAVGATNGAQQTTTLTNAYTAGSAGNSFGARLVLPINRTLTDLYFFITGYTGTAANVNDINWEVRTGTSTTVDTSGGALVASGSKDPASATGWIRISGLSVSLTSGTFYYLIIADADGNGTDFITCLNSHTNDLVSGAPQYASYLGASTANGYSTVIISPRCASVVSAFSDGTVLGNPYSASANSTSSTNRRGLYMSHGPSANVKVFGFASAIAATLTNGGEIIYDNTTPGGATIASTSILIAATTGISGVIFSSPVLLFRAVPCRLVLTFSGGATNPNKTAIGTGADANLRSAMLGGGDWYWAESNGTTDWSNDDINGWPFMTFLLEDFGPVGRLHLIN